MASRYHPTFTILGQMLASIMMVFSIIRHEFDVFIDTQGFPFTYPFVQVFKDIPVISYVHYPVVSSDMMSRVSGFAKQTYYWVMMKYYAMAGQSVDIAMVSPFHFKVNRLVNIGLKRIIWKF